MAEWETDTVVARSGDALHRVLDGEAVIVDLASGTYFGLNEVGTVAWEAIGDGARFGDLVARVVREFEVDEETAARDLRALLEEMHRRGLLRIGSDGPAER